MTESPAAGRPVWRLLSRPGCGLCVELARRLRTLLGPDADLRIDNVDRHAEWQRRFGARIPVLIDAAGRVVFEAAEDPATLPRKLAETAARPPG